MSASCIVHSVHSKTILELLSHDISETIENLTSPQNDKITYAQTQHKSVCVAVCVADAHLRD